MLPRHQVINGVLELFNDPSYLEVGVNQGHTFNKVHAARKVAVDPKFLFDTGEFADNHSIEFFEIPSDEYFARGADVSQPFDVIYLDGLHTFEQTLRDLLNSLSFLKPDGIIVIDDVLPNSFDASLPEYEQVTKLRRIAKSEGINWPFDGSWMGDVYKVPLFIEAFLQQYSYATVKENHGQAVVWRKARSVSAISPITVEALARFDYRDTVLRRNNFHILPFEQIVLEIKAERHS